MTQKQSPERSRARRSRVAYAVVIVAALIAGATLAPVAYSAANDLGGSDDTVAVVTVPPIIADGTTDQVLADLEEARQNDSIQAVVLEVNSPGGSVSATEEVALEVERTAEEMPVVTSVQSVAASGGYYVSAPTDKIYATPSAQVGSVGVRSSYMGSTGPSTSITTGPDKNGGRTEQEAIESVNVLAQGFYGTVMEHRGDKLTLSETELAYAKVYVSQQALHNGMIDEIGTTDTAIQAAAERADLDSYEVAEMGYEQESGGLLLFEATDDGEVVDLSGQQARTKLDPTPGVDRPVFLALYGTVPGEEPIASSSTRAPGDAATVQATGGDGA